MTTRIKLELDRETFGRLVESAVAEQRAADWQAEVILRRALGVVCWQATLSVSRYAAAEPSAANSSSTCI